MIATRVSGDPVSGNNGLSYFFNDHLGSNSTLRKPNGTAIHTRYLPFGGYRGTAPTQSITDRDFTGQRENMELGLLYYNARYYLPGMGRFISADTLVPNPTNPQSLNRYSYVRNSPINFTDPTGHWEDEGAGTIAPPPPPPPLNIQEDCTTLTGCNPPPPQVTKLWIDPNDVKAIQLSGNTNFAFKLGTDDHGLFSIPSYAYSQGFHGGLDLLAEPGTEVVAGIYGTVAWVSDWVAYKPRYIVIKIAPNTYMVIGHLSAAEPSNLGPGNLVTPDTIVGEVESTQGHVHIEFWTGQGPTVSTNRHIETPYQYLSPHVKQQFLALRQDMNRFDSRITFHQRSDEQWSSIYDQPRLKYNGSNLNVGQPGYNNPWD